MQPGVLTQELTMPSLGTLDTSSVLDLSMSVGMPAAGARAKDTPKTSACRANNGCGKKKVSTAAAGEQRRPTMKVGMRVVVERHHVSLRVLPNDPGHAVIDQHSYRNHNYFGVYVKKKDHCVYLIKFDLFPADAQPVPISREHIKRVLHKDEEEPLNDHPEEEIIEGENVDNSKEKNVGQTQLRRQVHQGVCGHGRHRHQ